ncbi:MAG TPA: phage major tail tube protein [Candidatus Binataceae bacterium]|nr:phage major tail tube protein [Candidatus Binataceae bacterium]
MNIQINSLTNANVYIDGVNLLGRAQEIEIAQPKHRMIDYKGLGMAGTAELWAGVEKLESRIKWASFDADALTIAASPFQSHQFQTRGNLEQYTSQGRIAELPVVYLMTGVFKDAGSPAFRQHQMVETSSSISVYHCELYVAGVQIYLYDVFANIYVVGGVDQLANFRSNLGG